MQLGHQVMMGSRTANSGGGQEWLRFVGDKAQIGTFADTAAFGDIVVDCVNGANSPAALRQAGAANLRGKILIQVGNPLDTSKGMPPSLTVCNTDSLGEQIQCEFPDVRVVKALNTVNCDIMVDPSRVPGDHTLFIAGNDAAAKREVTNWLSEWFGWEPHNIVDLGDITNSRGTEMFLALWGTVVERTRNATFQHPGHSGAVGPRLTRLPLIGFEPAKQKDSEGSAGHGIALAKWRRSDRNHPGDRFAVYLSDDSLSTVVEMKSKEDGS